LITLLIFSRIWIARDATLIPPATTPNASAILHTEYLDESGDPTPGFWVEGKKITKLGWNHIWGRRCWSIARLGWGGSVVRLHNAAWRPLGLTYSTNGMFAFSAITMVSSQPPLQNLLPNHPLIRLIRSESSKRCIPLFTAGPSEPVT
jgi:hypothetical protein